MGALAVAIMNIARGLFVPKGYPDSVAPEYAHYQLWDTVQQTTYFINTVISKRAIMKFHGVGDVNATPLGATVRELGRDGLAQFVSVFARVPAMTRQYKQNVAPYRMLSEILNAVGHFMEILAALFNHVVALLYGGPMVMNISSAMSGATRARILQHFAKVGNNGDVSLKESNQDKGGKIVGAIVGLVLLLLQTYYLGAGQSETEAICTSAFLFLILTSLHIVGNIAAVKKLDIKPEAKKASQGEMGMHTFDTAAAAEDEECTPLEADSSTSKGAAQQQATCPAGFAAFCTDMFLPANYPESVAPEYTKYRMFAALNTCTGYPKRVVVSMAFWSAVYGVGDSSKSPMQALLIDIFLVSIDAVVGLFAGIPIISERLNYASPKWKLGSGLLGITGEIVRLAAALSPQSLFYPLIIFSAVLSAFGGTSGKFINADIQRKWSRDPELVGLVDINITGSNQNLVMNLISGGSCVAYLLFLVSTDTQPLQSPRILLTVYAALQVICVLCQFGSYHNIPDEAPYEKLKKDLEPDDNVEGTKLKQFHQACSPPLSP